MKKELFKKNVNGGRTRRICKRNLAKGMGKKEWVRRKGNRNGLKERINSNDDGERIKVKKEGQVEVSDQDRRRFEDEGY
jgi:hypothetical protein